MIKKLLSLISYYYHYLYLFFMALIIGALPIWPLLTSISFISVTALWLLNGFVDSNFKKYYKQYISQKSILFFTCIFLIHIIGLLYTTDFKYALNDLQIKLPLLSFPLVVSVSGKLSLRELKIILYFFVFTLILSSFIGLEYLFTYALDENFSNRKISRIISHIRFSLLINVAIFSMLHIVQKHSNSTSKAERVFLYAAIIYLIVFLFVLQSLTGIFVFIILSYVFIFYRFFYANKGLKPSVITVSMSLLPIVFLGYIVWCVIQFYSIKEETTDLDKFTQKGNLYYHNFDDKRLENGYYIGLYNNDKELREAWNKISEYKYDSLDKKGQQLKFTLSRYLTSKGLRKDSAGVEALNTDDIHMVECGYSNYIFNNKYTLYPRIYQGIWELDVYFKGGNPSGHSISQRFEFMKTGIFIFLKNPIFGVGTGDVKQEYKKTYKKSGTKLSEKYWVRAHNQFLTFFITFGSIGGVIILICVFYPIILESGFKNKLFITFFIIAFLSMFNEDTIETQAGVTFFIYFYTLYLWGIEKEI